jgi:hypothetical protein
VAFHQLERNLKNLIFLCDEGRRLQQVRLIC